MVFSIRHQDSAQDPGRSYSRSQCVLTFCPRGDPTGVGTKKSLLEMNLSLDWSRREACPRGGMANAQREGAWLLHSQRCGNSCGGCFGGGRPNRLLGLTRIRRGSSSGSVTLAPSTPIRG